MGFDGTNFGGIYVLPLERNRASYPIVPNANNAIFRTRQSLIDFLK